MLVITSEEVSFQSRQACRVGVVCVHWYPLNNLITTLICQKPKKSGIWTSFCMFFRVLSIKKMDVLDRLCSTNLYWNSCWGFIYHDLSSGKTDKVLPYHPWKVFKMCVLCYFHQCVINRKWGKTKKCIGVNLCLVLVWHPMCIFPAEGTSMTSIVI